MKDQYFGDINDYRKYGILRALSSASGLRVGMCWLRTANDGRNDGEFRRYLDEPDRFRHHDPGLFDALVMVADPKVERSTTLAERWDLLPHADHYHALLTDDRAERTRYFDDALRLLTNCSLVFFDPDVGIEVPSCAVGRVGSSRYVYWNELEAAARRGHSILVYQHFKREKRETHIGRVFDELKSRLGLTDLTCFKTAHVAFFLAAQPAHAAELQAGARRVAFRWAGQVEVVEGNPQ